MLQLEMESRVQGAKYAAAGSCCRGFISVASEERFDEFFRHEQVIEVDAPGLTSPMLSRFPWQHMPRPVLPIDATASWSPEAA